MPSPSAADDAEDAVAEEAECNVRLSAGWSAARSQWSRWLLNHTTHNRDCRLCDNRTGSGNLSQTLNDRSIERTNAGINELTNA